MLSCTPGKQKGGWDESERTPVNIVNKGSFQYTGFQYTLLLVDYDTFCEHSSTGGIDEECDMEGERHLLSNHMDIEGTINNAIEHFLSIKGEKNSVRECLQAFSSPFPL